jgi:hypothetical protein
MAILEVEAFEDLVDVTCLTDPNSVIGSLDFNTKNIISITEIFVIKLGI